uniref:Uncharacterized protein n=1 Tax=Steinernema glaseri TaxID=37863 RepID=A0A1I7ZJ17_9BILA
MKDNFTPYGANAAAVLEALAIQAETNAFYEEPRDRVHVTKKLRRRRNDNHVMCDEWRCEYKSVEIFLSLVLSIAPAPHESARFHGAYTEFFFSTQYTELCFFSTPNIALLLDRVVLMEVEEVSYE